MTGLPLLDGGQRCEYVRTRRRCRFLRPELELKLAPWFVPLLMAG